MQVKNRYNSYFLVLALSQEQSTGYTSSDETTHPTSTRSPKATNATSHSLLHKHVSRELYTRNVMCKPCRRTFSLHKLQITSAFCRYPNYRSLDPPDFSTIQHNNWQTGLQIAFPFTAEGADQKKYFSVRMLTVHLTSASFMGSMLLFWQWKWRAQAVMNSIANIVTWVPNPMENIKFNRGLRQTLVLILHFQPPIGSLGTTLTVFIPRSTCVAGEWEIGRHDQNQWVNPYPHRLCPSTLWLLVVMDADEMLMSHHPDPHLYLWSRHDSCRGCDVQPPLPKVHKGIVAPVFCLDEAVIDLLSQQTTKQTKKKAQEGQVQSAPSLKILAGPGHLLWRQTSSISSTLAGEKFTANVCEEEKFSGDSNSHCRLWELFVLWMEDWDLKLGYTCTVQPPPTGPGSKTDTFTWAEWTRVCQEPFAIYGL